MAALFLPLSLFWLTVWFFRHRRPGTPATGWREALLTASLAWGLWLVVTTEVLGRFQAIGFAPLLAAWLLLTTIALFLALRTRPGPPPVPAPAPFLDREGFLLLSGIAVLAGLTGFIAWTSAPNNWDAMTYHLGRVLHWEQNRSVAFFPTSLPRQLYFPPLSEYAFLHLQIMGGGDRFAALASWAAFLGCLVGVSLLARELGAGPRGQLLSAVFAATLPMAILEAPSTMNDLPVAYALILQYWFLLRFRARGRLAAALGSSLSLGLALFTKATAWLFGFPGAAWLGWSLLLRRGYHSLPLAFLLLLLPLLLNAPLLLRNQACFGHPLGDEDLRKMHLNASPGLSPLGSNIVRNLALHLTPPSFAACRYLQSSVELLHRSLGLDPSDPGTTWRTFSLYPWILRSWDEAFSGNLLHLPLLGGALLVLFSSFRGRGRRDLWLYLGSLLLGFLFFCGTVKWMFMHSRLHLPLFLLGAPLAGLAGENLKSRWPATLLALLLLAAGTLPACYNQLHPLTGPESILRVPRERQYCSGYAPYSPGARRILFQSFMGGASFLARHGARDLGLYLDPWSFEYPLRVLFRYALGDQLRFRHVLVSNPSSRLPVVSEDFMPAALLSLKKHPPGELTVADRRYRLAWQRYLLSIYLPVL